MRWLISAYRRLRGLIRAEKIHREIDEEAQFHVDMTTDENIRRGMSPEEARLDAERRFGNLTRVKERGYDVRGGRWLETLWLDLRYGARVLIKNPGFTLVAALTLALGIGATTAIFSVVDGVLLRPLPYKDPQKLLMIWATRAQDLEFPIMSADFADLRKQNQVFEQVTAFRPQSVNLTGIGEPERLGGIQASTNLFTLLGIEAKLGRTFLPEEEQPGNHRVVILNYGLWQRRFGADEQIIGKTISLNDEPHTIVGVMPPGFQFPRKGAMPIPWQFPGEVEIYIPLALTPDQINIRGRNSLAVISRLKSQFSLEQAQAEMTGFAQKLQQQYPNTNRDRGIRLVTLHQQTVGGVKLALTVLLGAVGFVLLIACTNVANLLLVRAAARQKEIALRAALGASRWRVVRQLLTENALLALLSGSLALGAAIWGVKLLQIIIPEDQPRTDEIGIDGRVFGFTLLISLFTSLLFGLVPALQASKLSLSEALKEGGRGSGRRNRNHFRNLLVVSEIAMALVLLICAGLMLRSFVRLMSIDPGLNPQNVLTLDIQLSGRRYAPPQRTAFFQQLLEKVNALPGVEAAGIVWPLPLAGTDDGVGFTFEDQPPPSPGERRVAGPRVVSPDYFKTLKIQLQRGRVFSETDGPDTPPVIIINETLARRYWPNEDPIGKRMAIDVRNGQPFWREIIGVVGNVRHLGLDKGPRLEIYFPFPQFRVSFQTLVVRTDDPLSLVAAIRNQVQTIDKDQPISNIRTMEELLGRSVSQQRFSLLLMGIFAGVALALAAVGIYGVMSYLVAQRTHEIGVRMALGAQVNDVLKLVVKQGMTLTLTGVLAGLITAIGLTRLISNLLFGVSSTDLLTYISIAALLILVALAACWIPARRATKVDPLVALRCE
jgi:putative ABC transport system permease protein